MNLDWKVWIKKLLDWQIAPDKTNGPTREGITLLRWTAVFNPMSHVGTHAQQLDQYAAS